MTIYTIGFTHKTARKFFNLLVKNKVELLVDIRLNNSSQLAGFTKSADLEYFLDVIGKIAYLHYPLFAPTKELLKDFQAKKITWEQYKSEFESLLKTRNTLNDYKKQIGSYKSICLLCSEEKPEHCHRSLVAQYLHKKIKRSVIKDL